MNAILANVKNALRTAPVDCNGIVHPDFGNEYPHSIPFYRAQRVLTYVYARMFMAR